MNRLTSCMADHVIDDARSCASALTAALATKDRLEAILLNAMDAIVTINEQRRIVFFNPAAETMFGIPRLQALGEPIERFIPERFRAAHSHHIDQFGQTSTTARRMGALGAISGLRADGTEFPIEASISQALVDGERLSTVILRDITERLANEQIRALLAREVDHRAKNALALVQALVSLTRAPTHESFVEAVEGRVSAIARAHSLLARNQWHGGNLAHIIAEEVAAYVRPGQLACHGPEVMLGPNAVQPLGLLIHELATNAVKYGALSAVDGRLQLNWAFEADGGVRLEWRELNGPPVIPPQQKGFGSTLISTVAAQQLNASIDIDYAPAGVVVTAILPSQVLRSPRDGRVQSLGGLDNKNDQRAEAMPNRARRVLLVEDEVLIGMQMAQVLGDCGWSVMGPANTLAEAEEEIAASGMPDIAVLDVNLNGETVGPLARSLDAKGVPVLLCTGYEQLTDPTLAGYALVRKPANMRQLIAVMERTLKDRTHA